MSISQTLLDHDSGSLRTGTDRQTIRYGTSGTSDHRELGEAVDDAELERQSNVSGVRHLEG